MIAGGVGVPPLTKVRCLQTCAPCWRAPMRQFVLTLRAGVFVPSGGPLFSLESDVVPSHFSFCVSWCGGRLTRPRRTERPLAGIRAALDAVWKISDLVQR